VSDSIAAANAAQSDFYRDHPRDDAQPGWDDLSPAEQDGERMLGEHSVWFPAFEQEEPLAPPFDVTRLNYFIGCCTRDLRDKGRVTVWDWNVNVHKAEDH
jgi:hypothetical protein